MKEPYVEGVATHGDPESCADAREGSGEALTGARTGSVLSREINKSGEPARKAGEADAVNRCGRPHARCRHREAASDPARSETPRTCGIFLRENREIRALLTADGAVGRIGKAGGRSR